MKNNILLALAILMTTTIISGISIYSAKFTEVKSSGTVFLKTQKNYQYPPLDTIVITLTNKNHRARVAIR